MTDKYMIIRTDDRKNLYKIIGPNGTPPYFITGCLGVGRELGDSQIPDNLVDFSQLSDIERNIIKIAKDARLVWHERKKHFMGRLQALDQL